MGVGVALELFVSREDFIADVAADFGIDFFEVGFH